MSYEKVKIIGIRQVVKKDTGQIHHFLQIELLQSFDIYLNEEAMKQIPLYDKIRGKEALIPTSWGEYNGKPSLNLTDDYIPLPAPVRSHVV